MGVADTTASHLAHRAGRTERADQNPWLPLTTNASRYLFCRGD